MEGTSKPVTRGSRRARPGVTELPHRLATGTARQNLVVVDVVTEPAAEALVDALPLPFSAKEREQSLLALALEVLDVVQQPQVQERLGDGKGPPTSLVIPGLQRPAALDGMVCFVREPDHQAAIGRSEGEVR